MAAKSGVNFHAPEFDKVFKRIAAMQNKDGYQRVRQLNKFHEKQFDPSIQSASLKIQNLESLALSKFADQIRFLCVQIPDDFENLDRLCYASTHYFRNIERVDVVFTEGEQLVRTRKKIRIQQALVFRGLNIFSADKDNRKKIELQGNQQDVQIINSNFEGIGLRILSANKITIKNTSFQNISSSYGLFCGYSKNTTTIENVRFLSCRYGLEIMQCQNKVQINKILAKNCEIVGCCFDFINDLILDNAEITDCNSGIWCRFTNAIFKNCQITDFKDRSFELYGSTVNYRQIYLKKFDEDVDVDFNTVDLRNSTFEELL